MPSRFDISLTLENVSLSRGDLPLLARLNLVLYPGQALWLTGPNGIGKTTLLLACAGLITPDEGRVEWTYDNQPVPPEFALAYAAHRGPERNGLTLGEEFAFWQQLHGDTETLADRFQTVGLSGREATPVAGLSAGQRRRLSLARLLSSGKAAWLMDEPLAGLDVDGRNLVTNALGEHLDRGGIAIIASHQPVPIKGVEALKLVLQPSEAA